MSTQNRSPFLIVALNLLAVAAMAGALVFGIIRSQAEEQTSAQQGSFPQELGDLSLVSKVSGEEAFGQIARLHGRRMPLKEAYILLYKNGQKFTRIWISVSFEDSEADELAARMATYLPRSQMYSNPESVSVANKSVYRTKDRHTGSLNYFWAAPPEVIWVETNLAEKNFLPLLAEIAEKL